MKNKTSINHETANSDLAAVRRSFSWETKELPYPQSIDSECNGYYLVKVKGYAHPTMAMYMEDENGNAGWYTNYFSKIIKEVEAWADVS